MRMDWGFNLIFKWKITSMSNRLIAATPARSPPWRIKTEIFTKISKQKSTLTRIRLFAFNIWRLLPKKWPLSATAFERWSSLKVQNTKDTNRFWVLRSRKEYSLQRHRQQHHLGNKTSTKSKGTNDRLFAMTSQSPQYITYTDSTVNFIMWTKNELLQLVLDINTEISGCAYTL